MQNHFYNKNSMITWSRISPIHKLIKLVPHVLYIIKKSIVYLDVTTHVLDIIFYRHKTIIHCIMGLRFVEFLHTFAAAVFVLFCIAEWINEYIKWYRKVFILKQNPITIDSELCALCVFYIILVMTNSPGTSWEHTKGFW